MLAVEAVLASAGRHTNGVAEDTASKTNTGVPLFSLETPYGQPQAAFDPPPLLDLVIAKVSEADDHVWALRTDSAYLRSNPDRWAADHMRLNATARNSVSVNIIDSCIRRALEQTEAWSIVYAKVHLLAQHMEKHAVAVAETKPNKTKLLRNVLSLYAVVYHIRSFEDDSIGLLQSEAAASGGGIWELTGLKDDTAVALWPPGIARCT